MAKLFLLPVIVTLRSTLTFLYKCSRSLKLKEKQTRPSKRPRNLILPVQSLTSKSILNLDLPRAGKSCYRTGGCPVLLQQEQFNFSIGPYSGLECLVFYFDLQLPALCNLTSSTSSSCKPNNSMEISTWIRKKKV